MAWLYLFVAGALRGRGHDHVPLHGRALSRIVPTDPAVRLSAIASLYFLNRSLSGIPLGTAYAVWTGIGAAGTAMLGVALYGEDATSARILLLVALIACIVGLKYVSAH